MDRMMGSLKLLMSKGTPLTSALWPQCSCGGVLCFAALQAMWRGATGVWTAFDELIMNNTRGNDDCAPYFQMAER